MKLIDLSHTIIPDMFQWPGDNQPLKIHRHSVHGPDSHMSSSLEFGCHVGTHIDGSLHFLDGQPALHEISVDRFAGRALIVDATASGADSSQPSHLLVDLLSGQGLADIDFVLFHTGWDRFWGQDNYYRHWPWIDGQLAVFLAEHDLKGVGLDTPSLDRVGDSEAHDRCAAAGMINIENLTGLKSLSESVVNFMAVPLKLHKTEASPVRAVAWL
ncbi:MAG: cyclase family protein [bacterium]|nr:cyclase family protein [bacterium]